MAGGRLRAVLADLDLTSSRRRVKEWVACLADCMFQSRARSRRISWRMAQQIDPCETRIMPSGMAPFASSNSYSLSKDSYTVAASGVLANDYDMESDPLTAVLFSNPTNGTVTLNSNGSFTYTPNVGYAGSDSFQYRAYDGTSYSSATTVSLTVTNSWSAQTNAVDRVFEPAGDFGAVEVVGYTGDAQVIAPVGDGHGLIYSSNSDAKPIIAVEVDLNGGSPTSLESVLTFNGVAGSTVYYNTTGLSGTTRLRFSQQADATNLASGKYAWSMSLVARYSDGSTSTRAYTGSSLVVNWNTNAEGDSWNIADKDRLVSVSGGMLLIRGDGGTALFSDSGGAYTSPAGPYAFSTLVQNTGPVWTLTDQYGSAMTFSSVGNLTSRSDSNSNSTAYTYVDGDSDGQTDDLSTITDPWGVSRHSRIQVACFLQ
ncbi:MAG: cadherin-like domain-containing protein [Planctomyces sp.]|nr:cadherin-like domain-containing protein [Planctomyces sp.]